MKMQLRIDFALRSVKFKYTKKHVDRGKSRQVCHLVEGKRKTPQAKQWLPWRHKSCDCAGLKQIGLNARDA